MKKRMFLTTALMVLLLVVAVSTATFAWFSASNAVNVSVIMFTATSSDAGGKDLAVAWTEDGIDSYEITFAENEDMRPMIPKNAPSIGQSYDSFFTYESDGVKTANFHSASQSFDEETNAYVYIGAVLPETPTKCRSLEGKNEFYLINKNADFAQKVTVKFQIRGDNAEALCVALFADGVLIGIMGGGEKLYYGDIVSGARIDAQDALDNLISDSGNITFDIAAGGVKKMKMAAWYSGVDLTNDDAEKTAMLSSLEFIGEYAG